MVDKVWVTERHKLQGICDDVDEAHKQGSAVLVVAHFEATRSAVEGAFRDRSIEFHRTLPVDGSSLCNPPGESGSKPVWLVLASNANVHSLSTSRSSSGPGLCILAAEHHPLVSRDQELVELAGKMPCQSRLTFHIALSDAMMARFGSEKILGLLKALGHDEKTFISHSMISKAIRNAQEKIEKKVRRETSASSAEEWLRFNLD